MHVFLKLVTELYLAQEKLKHGIHIALDFILCGKNQKEYKASKLLENNFATSRDLR